MLRFALPTACLLAASLALPTEAAELAIDSIEVGFSGAYRPGSWTPLSVRATGAVPEGTSVSIETVTADADGASVVRTSPAQAMSSGATLMTVIQSGRNGSDLTVRVKSADGAVVAESRLRYETEALPVPAPKSAVLWVTVGGFNGEAGRTRLPAPAGVTVAPLQHLSVDGLGYSSANALFIRGDLVPTTEQAEAVRRWVAGGGHLVVALGRHTDAFTAGPFATWFPFRIEGTVQLFDRTRLEDYSRSNRRLPRSRLVTAARLDGAVKTLLDDPAGDLIVRSPYGFGRVTAFAIDLDEPPFSNWEALPDVLARAVLDEGAGAVASGGGADTGVTDLATQLLRAEEVLPGVERPPAGRALYLLLIYAAVVGPLDYLIVHRLLRRPAMTWVTLPLIVLGGAWWLDREAVAANGAAAQISRLDLIDFDGSSGTGRGRTMLTLYSPASTRADFKPEPWVGDGADDGATEAKLRWSAPPEETFGGTYRETGGGLFRSEYEILPSGAAASEAKGVPLLVGASRRFEAAWQRDGGEPPVESALTAQGRGLLRGRVTHRLPGVVSDYLVAFGDRVYEPREAEWHPGDAIDLGSSAFLRRDMTSFLTRTQTKTLDKRPGDSGEKIVVTEGTYDPLSTDLDGVMRMITFHGAAGGTAYTGLTNVPLGTDDLTPLLELNRAVLIGRLDAPAGEPGVSGAEGVRFEPSRQTTFVRFVLPVEVAEVVPEPTARPKLSDLEFTP